MTADYCMSAQAGEGWGRKTGKRFQKGYLSCTSATCPTTGCSPGARPSYTMAAQVLSLLICFLITKQYAQLLQPVAPPSTRGLAAKDREFDLQSAEYLSLLLSLAALGLHLRTPTQPASNPHHCRLLMSDLMTFSARSWSARWWKSIMSISRVTLCISSTVVVASTHVDGECLPQARRGLGWRRAARRWWCPSLGTRRSGARCAAALASAPRRWPSRNSPSNASQKASTSSCSPRSLLLHRCILSASLKFCRL